jgi:rod shape-determining protein MreC
MLFSYNRFQHTAFLGVASEVTGSVNTQVDKLDDYFHLVEENRRVHKMNDSLLNLLRQNYDIPDTSVLMVTDSLRIDSLVQYRKYAYRSAKVVYNSTNFENNYLQLNKGANDSIRENMAVVSSEGAIVGLVVNVSPNFCQVMSLLHTKSNVFGMLKKSKVSGRITWDTKDPRFVTLSDISRDVEVRKGDTVVSNQYSYNYPPGFMIGRVDSIRTEKATGFYTIRVRTAARFNSIQQVFIVENLQRDEQAKLNKETEEKMKQDRRTNR